MPQTFIDGTVNIAGLTVPGAYFDIVPPQPIINGVPSNIMGIVGVASWGPVGAPQFFSTLDQGQGLFGPPLQRTYDLMTYVAAGGQVGNAVSWCGVRVSDGTDVAASVIILTTCITITAKYTGSYGNQIAIVLGTGTLANSFSASISFPGRAPEFFNNIPGTANAFWVNLASAINNGNASRGFSNYVVATAGAGTTAPVLGTSYALTLGTDGASTVTAANVIGVDTLPRKGIYALRGTGCDSFAACDVTDATTFAAQASFGLSETMMAVTATAAGDAISTCAATRVTNAVDYLQEWMLLGDWPYFYDATTNIQNNRLVSPQAFALGLLGNLAPQLSPLNKQLTGVTATQRSLTRVPYGQSDLSQANLGGIDLIIPPVNTPGGPYFSFATGRNTSSNTGANGVEYTRLTFWLIRSMNTVAGQFVGQLQSRQPNDPFRQKVTVVFTSFLQALANPALGVGNQGVIDTPFIVQCDLLNNPIELQVRGFCFVYLTVPYLNTVRYFVVKLAGGGQPTTFVQATPPSPAQFA